jgi:hypothetical protein
MPEVADQSFLEADADNSGVISEQEFGQWVEEKCLAHYAGRKAQRKRRQRRRRRLHEATHRKVRHPRAALQRTLTHSALQQCGEGGGCATTAAAAAATEATRNDWKGSSVRAALGYDDHDHDDDDLDACDADGDGVTDDDDDDDGSASSADSSSSSDDGAGGGAGGGDGGEEVGGEEEGERRLRRRQRRQRRQQQPRTHQQPSFAAVLDFFQVVCCSACVAVQSECLSARSTACLRADDGGRRARAPQPGGQGAAGGATL